MAFNGDGFIGDGILDAEVVEVENPLSFVREGKRTNIYVEFEASPRFVNLPEVDDNSELVSDGFVGDGFIGTDFFENVATAPITVRCSTLPTNFKADDPVLPNQTSKAIIRNNIRLKQSLDEKIDGSSTQIQTGSIELDNTDGFITGIVTNYRVDGRPVRIYVLPEGGRGDELVLVATAFIETIQTTDRVGRPKTATLKLNDLSGSINDAVQQESFTGTGSLAGDPELAGRLKPILWGKRKNVQGIRYDKLNNLWMISTGEVTFGDGRFGGEVAPYHGDFADEDALIAARSSMPEGSWATCRALGIFTPRPTGDTDNFTFTVEATGFGVEQVGDIIDKVFRQRTSLGDRVSANGLAALNVGPGGRYLDGSSSESVQQFVNILSQSVFGRLVYSDTITAVLFRDPAEQSFDVEISKYAIASELKFKGRSDPSYKEFQVRYSPNDAQLSASQIVLPESNAAFKEELQRPFETLVAAAGELTPTEHLSAKARFVHRTSLIEKSDAAALQQRLKVFGQYEREVWQVQLRADEIDIALGAIVRLQIEENEYWASGRNALVIGRQPEFVKGRVVLDLMV